VDLTTVVTVLLWTQVLGQEGKVKVAAEPH
jgi:hypothetical protein